jgi:BirA family transcriptional regulator, biotin operon repressor / biotin---[acetyl-CoA-carboxylase] ligase
MNEELLRATLGSLPLGGLRYYQTIGSTNDAALAWAAEGALDLSLIIAEEQTHGRGRSKRQWITNPESALAFSLVLHPVGVDSVIIPLYSALGALAVTKALEMAGLHPQIKWPNDVLLNRKKVCGILAESVWSGEKVSGVVLGIGVNVKSGSVPPQETLLFPATCLESEVGHPMDRVSILRDILSMLIKWRPVLGSEDFIRAWEQRLAFQGEWVTVSSEGKPVCSGRVTGLEEDGGLCLEDDTGKTISVQFGEVSLRSVV